MIESDIIKFIRDEIRRQVQVILSGESGNNTGTTEDIASQYPGMATQMARPIMHPYGFVSRAPAKTLQVTARRGDHPANTMVLGHTDPNRPTDLDQGEAGVYNLLGYRITLKKDKISINNGAKDETMVLGETLVTFLGEFLDLIISHTHTSPGSPPTNAAAFQQLKSLNIDPVVTILAKKEGGF